MADRLTDQELIERAATCENPHDVLLMNELRETVCAIARELEAFKRAMADDFAYLRKIGSPPASAEASPGLRPVESRLLGEAEAVPAASLSTATLDQRDRHPEPPPTEG